MVSSSEDGSKSPAPPRSKSRSKGQEDTPRSRKRDRSGEKRSRSRSRGGETRKSERNMFDSESDEEIVHRR